MKKFPRDLHGSVVLPQRFLHTAKVIVSRRGVVKVRQDVQYMNLLMRMMAHLGEDEMVVIVSRESIRQMLRSEQEVTFETRHPGVQNPFDQLDWNRIFLDTLRVTTTTT